jgi:DNA polymerase elongation subunit (family B)
MSHPRVKPVLRTTLTPDLQYTHATTIRQNVLVRARSADGRAHFIKTAYRPTYYLPTNEYTGETSLEGCPLLPYEQDSIREGRTFLSEHREAYGNIQCEYMLLSDVYGAEDIVPEMDRLLIWNFDIEVDSETSFAPPENPTNEITAITVMWRHRGERGTVTYGLQPYEAAEGVEYVQCEDETALLKRFIQDWRADYPDIVTGWNVQLFDIPYLIGRIRRVINDKAANSLSPYNYLTERKVMFYGREQLAVDIRGVATLDYLELYRKFTFTQQESYRLDHIAHVELGQRKLSYAEYRSLSALYVENYAAFMDYNVQDVQLVESLDDKMKLIELVCALAYSAKANYSDTFRQVRLWDTMIYHHLRAQHQQIPPKKSESKDTQYIGAYVKPPQVGQHEWVCSFDVASMYPHIIRQWNLSPEMLVDRRIMTLTVDTLLDRTDVSEHLWDGDQAPEGYALAANGVLTQRDKEGFLPAMLKALYAERIRFKNLATKTKKQRELLATDDPQYAVLTRQIAAYHNQQLVRKVNLNSAYGAIGSNYFRYYDVDMAEAVTLTGQFVIRDVANAVNAYLNKMFKTSEDYIVASDTDSIYVKLGRVVDKYKEHKPTASMSNCVAMLDQFCAKRIEPVLVKSFASIAEYLHVAVPCLTMTREVIANKGVWTAKKRYILNVCDNEGVIYQKPKLKIMGIEAVKSSTPAVCREMIIDVLKLFMNSTQEKVWAYIKAQREVFGRAKFEDIAFPRSVNGLEKYGEDRKGCPIQVRGALVYNEQIAGMSKYENIRNGQKIRFAYLREPNRFQTHVLAAPDGCPESWNVEKMLDYEKQWQKSFLEPVAAILSAAKWNVEKQNVLPF